MLVDYYLCFPASRIFKITKIVGDIVGDIYCVIIDYNFSHVIENIPTITVMLTVGLEHVLIGPKLSAKVT